VLAGVLGAVHAADAVDVYVDVDVYDYDYDYVYDYDYDYVDASVVDREISPDLVVASFFGAVWLT
jgi:hypothetical protein